VNSTWDFFRVLGYHNVSAHVLQTRL
jgi:hypothetical protein